MKKKIVRGTTQTAWALTVVGAILWGLAALGVNLIAILFGAGILTTIIYSAVGLAAVWIIAMKLLKRK